MSDDSTWRPPTPDGGDEPAPPPPPPTPPPQAAVPPPPSEPPIGPPSEPSAGPPLGPPAAPPDDATTVDAGPPERRRSPLGLVAAVVAVVLIGVAGVFAVTRIMGGDEGGAASPEELADELFTAIDDSDVLGLADLVLPSERDTFVGPLTEIVDELRRLEIVSPAAGADGIEGVTFEVTRTSVRVRPTNVDDIVNLDLNADVTVTIDGERLPIGDLVVDLVDDLDRTELDTRETEPLDLTLTAVEEGGRWYLSALFTFAEAARAEMSPRPDIPATGIEPRGGDTPEGAVEALLAGVERLDLDQIVAALNPGEASVLHRYGPAFLGDAQTELDLVPLRWEVTGADLVATGSGSTRTVGVERLAIEGRFDGAPFELELADGCMRATAEGERFDSCEDTVDEFSLDDLLGDSAAARELVALLEDVGAAYEPTGITVREVDGQWFVSPVGTLFDQLLAVLRSIDRDDIERFFELVPAVIDDVFAGDPFVFDDEFFDDEFFDDEFGQDDPFAPSPLDECFTLADVDEAIECFRLAAADGEIEPFEIPLELRYPECGAAEVSWQGYFELSDDEFIEFAERVRPCFLDLIDAGEISEFDLPLALSDPDCFEGRNWYAVFDDPEYDDRVFECIGF